MGAAGSSLPEVMSHDTCRNLCGDAFNEDVYQSIVDASGRSDGQITKSAFEEFLRKTDVFLTHDWGKENGVDNHARVSKINAGLKKKGLTTWFDEEQMQGNIKVRYSYFQSDTFFDPPVFLFALIILYFIAIIFVQCNAMQCNQFQPRFPNRNK